MIIDDFNTNTAAFQLNLLFDIKAIFKRRGRKVSSFDKVEELLFDPPTPIDAFEKYYHPLSSTSFRHILSLVANSNSGMRFPTILSQCTNMSVTQIEEILEKAVELKLLTKRGFLYQASNKMGFGPTFEWYVAAVCIHELSSIAYWGVKIEELTGDYDVVLIRENQIGYIECKSGKLSNINEDEINNFLKRERILAPQFSIFLVDGVSRENLKILVNFALKQKLEYEFGIPGVMDTSISLEFEEYKNFVRLTPINSFFVCVENSVASALREIYEFLTLVSDRQLITENIAAKIKFR